MSLFFLHPQIRFQPENRLVNKAASSPSSMKNEFLAEPVILDNPIRRSNRNLQFRLHRGAESSRKETKAELEKRKRRARIWNRKPTTEENASRYYSCTGKLRLPVPGRSFSFLAPPPPPLTPDSVPLLWILLEPSRDLEKYFSARSFSSPRGRGSDSEGRKGRKGDRLRCEEGWETEGEVSAPFPCLLHRSVEVSTHNQFMKHREATVLGGCRLKQVV